MGYTPHVLVVGGGATGTAVARDLAMRGLEVTLVERGTLANGTSGSMHALLHSGARYADDDPETARICRRENAILRETAGHLVAETGGLFASLPTDPDDYVGEKREACEAAGIETTGLSGAAAREREPALAPAVERALAVPDAVVDPFRLCLANARSALGHGAEVMTGWRVSGIDTDGGAIDRVKLANEDPDVAYLSSEKLRIVEPDYVVNAAGPWAGSVAAMADLDVPIRHAQGAMVVVERAGLETVVNRCRPRTQGDIAVPFGATSVLGTTDRDIDGPEAVDRRDSAVDFLVDELGDLVPAVASARPYRAYWGVRALPPDDADASEKATRSYRLYDHEARDGLWGVSTVHGGKLTIHRHVAEQVADHVCGKFGIDRPCQTAQEPLPTGPDPSSTSSDSSPTGLEPGAAGRGGPPATDPALCPCVGVTASEARSVIVEDDLRPPADLRPVVQQTRAGMGACQGGRCAHRLAGELYPEVEESRVTRAFADLAAERWRGQRHALWGEQFATAARTYRLHAGTMNRGGLPGPTDGPTDYAAFDDWQRNGGADGSAGDAVDGSAGDGVDGSASDAVDGSTGDAVDGSGGGSD